MSDTGCQPGLLVAGNRIQPGQIEAGRGIYSKGGEVAHRLTGKDGKSRHRNKEARPQLATGKPSSRSQCSEDNATAALARALTSGAPGSEFCCCSCCPQPLVTSRDVPCPCSVAFLFLYGWGAWRLTSLGRSPRSLAARDAGTTPIHHSRSTLGG